MAEREPIVERRSWGHREPSGRCPTCEHARPYPGGREDWMGCDPFWCNLHDWRVAPEFACPDHEKVSP